MNDFDNLQSDLNELAGLQPDVAATQRALERATAALVAATAAIPPHPSRPNFGAIIMRPRNLVAIAASALFIVLATQWFSTPSVGSVAFAQVQDQVAKTKSAQYTEVRTDRMKDSKATVEMQSRVMILGTSIE